MKIKLSPILILSLVLIGVYFSVPRSTLPELGYIARYLLGDVPPWMFEGRDKEGYRYFFLSSEIPLQYRAESKRIAEMSAQYVKKIRLQLEKFQIPTVIVPIPTKLSFNRENAPVALPRFEIWKQDHLNQNEKNLGEDPKFVYQTLLRESEIRNPRYTRVLDLDSKFRKRLPTQAVFHPTDSHWTEYGVQDAVEEIAAALYELEHSSSQKLKAFPFHFEELLQKNSEENRSLNRDLVRALQLPLWFLKLRKEFQWLEHYESLKVKTPSFGGKKSGRIVVVGTSYCAYQTRNQATFPRWLEEITGRELYQLCNADIFFSGWIPELYRRGFRFRPNDILIWEFPIRNVPLPTSESEISLAPKVFSQD